MISTDFSTVLPELVLAIFAGLGLDPILHLAQRAKARFQLGAGRALRRHERMGVLALLLHRILA